MIATLESQPSMVAVTLDTAAAGAGRWQCAIIGAGPGGAAAAVRLARRGLAVILIDALPSPRPKVCGSCLSPTAMHELRLLETSHGPTASIVARVRPLKTVVLAAAGRQARIAMSGGGTLSRTALDPALVRSAIASGAAWLPDTRVTAVEEAATDVIISARHGDHPLTIRAEMVVLASGLGGTVRVAGDRGRTAAASSRVGLGAILPAGACDLPPGELLMAVARGGYCGLVRLEDDSLDLAAAIDRGALAAANSPAEAIATILEAALGRRATTAVAAAVTAATIRGTPPLTHATGPVAGPGGRILRIGDAAGYVEPFTGEGMGWALAAARLLDEAVGRPGAGRWGSVATAYADAYQRRFAPHHFRCRAVARAVRQPVVVGCVAAAARVLPGIAARALPMAVGGGPVAEVDA